MTLEKIILDLGNSEKNLGTTYVGTSRIKNWKDILIKSFDGYRILKIIIEREAMVKLRKKELERLAELEKETIRR